MSKPRDDFTETTIRTLRERVASRCSNPNCRIVTTGPSTVKDKVNRIGEAAHICAAASGGPRYDENMTSEERKSIDNGIWLCSNCADMIDKDWERYPIELLQQWKKDADEFALNEMGKKLPTVDEPLELLMASMTGTGLQGLPTRLKNISLAASQYLESIDPRLAVNIVFDKNCTTFHFAAKEEPVEMKLSLIPENLESFDEKMNNLFKYGEPLEATVNDFSFFGSEIFDRLKQDGLTNAKISFTPKNVDGKLKLKLTNGGDIYLVDDMVGTIFTGNQNISFQGKLFGDILQFSLRIPLPTGSSMEESNFSFSINFDIWNETDILSLPYFNKVYEFFEKLYSGFYLSGILEIEGEKLLSMNEKRLNDDCSIVEMYSTFKYIYLARKISKYFGKQIIFNRFEFYYDDLKEMENIVHAIEQYSVELKEDDAIKFSITITSDEHLHNMRDHSIRTKPIQMKLEAPDHKVNIFEEEIEIPKIRQIFTYMKLNKAPNFDSKKVGDSVEFEYVPQEGAVYSIGFIKEN
ncbi:HNH endonuclease [Sulfurovum riftiae]|uniref:HNH endonuclease n=1 Tax=Sulfurovum riftiae TaxID=1630136 RepID=A0A151CJF4_9BACT|nr:HNH endonuclease [Sulfurovum riftiae]KYJ87672.1 hypothetical protein AS592_11305 [Sulfurovum riftiae]